MKISFLAWGAVRSRRSEVRDPQITQITRIREKGTEVGDHKSGMDGGLDGWMNPFGRMIRMNRMIPAGLGGRRKTPQLNTLEGVPSEMRYARHGHEFNGVNPVQPQYDFPNLRGRRGPDSGIYPTLRRAG